MSSAIFFQQFKRIMVCKIFELSNNIITLELIFFWKKLCVQKLNFVKTDLYEDFLPIVLLNSRHKLVNKLSVFRPCSPLLSQSNIKLVIQKIFIVCANVKGYWQALQRSKRGEIQYFGVKWSNKDLTLKQRVNTTQLRLEVFIRVIGSGVSGLFKIGSCVHINFYIILNSFEVESIRIISSHWVCFEHL